MPDVYKRQAFVFFESRYASHDVLVCRVRFSAAEDVRRQAFLLENLLDLVSHAGLREESVRDDHRTVSYTHLDVYKRQGHMSTFFGARVEPLIDDILQGLMQ